MKSKSELKRFASQSPEAMAEAMSKLQEKCREQEKVIEVLSRENAEFVAACDACHLNATAFADDCAELKAENERLREALGFYATIKYHDREGGLSLDIRLDHGAKARAALAKKEGA